MSSLRIVGNLWTLEGHPNSSEQWSLEQKLRAIADAGFDDVTGDINQETVEITRQLGLGCIGWFLAIDMESITSNVARFKGLGVEHVTVFLGKHNTSAAEAAALSQLLAEAGDKAGLHLAIETHRDTATETPEKTAALLSAYRAQTGRELPVTWDFSHHALIKHLMPVDWPSRLLTEQGNVAAAELFHFRPFNAHHAQIPVRVNGSRTPEYDDFIEFVGQVMRLWRADPANANRTMRACPEVGPISSGYGLSHEPQPWSQAIALAADLKVAWDNAIL